MNLTVYQNIFIKTLNVQSITNSSVLQVGTSGIVKTHSQQYNTGGFTPIEAEQAPPSSLTPIVPLIPPSPLMIPDHHAGHEPD